MSEKKVTKKKVTKKITTRRKKREKKEVVDPNAPVYVDIEDMKAIDDKAKDAEIARLNMAAHDQRLKNLNLDLENAMLEIKLKQNKIEKEILKQKRYASQYEAKKEVYNLLLESTGEKYKVEIKEKGKLFYNAQNGLIE